MSIRSAFLPESIAFVQARPFSQSTRADAKVGKPKNLNFNASTDRPNVAPRPFVEEEPITQEPLKFDEDKPEKPEVPKQEASEQKPEEPEQEKKEGEEQKEKTGEEGEQKEKAEDLPPPPPHGDKTPWQVFMETMQTEFKASKEWNDSTKQLSDSGHQFMESERVRKLREGYSTTTGAVTDTAGKVLKTSASAIGKGAEWTWDTSVMKGIRKGANVTGEALDKATKPIRETEAFKNVKDVIDDGSSSKYGGWVEKEERKKAREAREKQRALQNGGSNGPMTEDPK